MLLALEKHYYGKEVLSEDEGQKVQIARRILAQLDDLKTVSEIVSFLCEEYQVSDRTARNWYQAAFNFYGNINKVDLEAKRYFIEQWTIKGIQQCWQAGKMKEFWRGIKELKHISGIMNQDIAVFTPKDLANNEWKELISEEVADYMIKAIGEKGVVNITDLIKMDAEEIEAEEVEDDTAEQ